MAAEGDAGGMTGYIKHHLEHLTVSVGDSPFMTLNIDSYKINRIKSMFDQNIIQSFSFYCNFP
jgi:hypothetical protein